MNVGGTGIPGLDMVLVWGGAVTILAGIGAIVWRGVRATVHLGRRVEEFMDDWAGEEGRPGVPGRAGVMERVSGIEDRLARVEHELYPNSGGSLRDAVDLANARLAQLLPDEEEPTAPPGAAPASP
ncbi:hypothetical protein OG235_37280 [Streptomyces sp. NBC_00024]|uniref:hypothetical protein n=1 Tax=Streptomyces sp. NBC_00024 TaxID=2903612 RepID=UPI00324E34D3